MSAIDFNVGLPSPKVEKDIDSEQNQPLNQGYEFKMNRLEVKNKRISKFSHTVPSNVSLEQETQQSIQSIKMISKFLMLFQKKRQGIEQNKRRYQHFQKMYEEKLFHPELKFKQQEKSRFLFDSNHFSFQIWRQLKMFYILLLLLIITFYWSFDNLEQALNDTESVIYTLLILDIIAQCNVSIVLKGQIITSRLTILNQYLRGSFLENLAFLISLFVIVQTNSKIAAIIFFITGIKIFYQIINRLQDYYDFDFIHSEMVKLIKLIVFINLLAHFIACLWHHIGMTSTEEENWLDTARIRTSSTDIRYIYSFYWSVTTMVTVGYGDITPKNTQEMTVCVLVILISCGVFAYSLNLIGEVLQTYNQYQENLNKGFGTLNNYFKQHNISEQLQSRSKNYLEYAIREQGKEGLNDVLNKLPSTLRQEIIEEAFVKMLPKIPILHDNFTQASLAKASKYLQIQCYLPGDYILNQFDQNQQALYFIEQGQVQVFEQQSKTELFDITSGQVFGLYEFFTEEEAKYSLICKTEARVFRLLRNDFINLLSKDDFESFHQIKHQYQFNIPIKNMKCQFCNAADHFTTNCKLFFFNRNISKLFLENQYLKQQRVPFERNYFKYESLRNQNVDNQLYQQRTRVAQFQFSEHYLQENLLDQSQQSFKLISDFNSVGNINKSFENLIPSDKKMISKPQINQLSKKMVKSELQQEKQQPLKEKYQILEIDRMKNFTKYFKGENSENQIKNYNSLRNRRESLLKGKSKIRKAMRFIQIF